MIKWQLLLQGLQLSLCFRPHFRQTVVSVSIAAAPESSCCPGGRVDFLLWGSLGTSAGCQTQLADVLHALSLSLHFSFLTARCVGLYFCQIKAQWIRTEIIASLSLHLASCYPAAVMVMITRQQHQSSRIILNVVCQDEGRLPGPPAAHWRGLFTANNTDMMLIKTILPLNIQLWKQDPLLKLKYQYKK